MDLRVRRRGATHAHVHDEVPVATEYAYERPTYSLWDGAVGGLIGGVLMGMTAMVLFPLLGIGGFWQPMNLIAALFNQAWGLIPGFELLPSLLGMLIHMMMSMGLGALFAWTASRTGGSVVLKAVIAGLVLWAIMDFLVLPLINPVMTEVFPEWLFALTHVMFGLGLGGYLAARGRRSEELETETATAGARA